MFRRILVYTFGDQNHDNTLRMAAAFAQEQKAELLGLFVKPDTLNYTSTYGSYPLDLVKTFENLQKSFSAKARSQFEKIAASYDLHSEWHETEEHEKDSNPAFFSDLIFIGQPNKESSVIFNDTDFVDHLITDTGVPTVIVPKDWTSNTPFCSPVLAWKATREAVGAVRHALPLMSSAKDVDIVTITKSKALDEELVDGVEICRYLNKHNINTNYFSETLVTDDHNEADALFRHVNNHNRDLIIAGGYGHSRFREIILGGMTRELIKRSPVPVLLSH